MRALVLVALLPSLAHADPIPPVHADVTADAGADGGGGDVSVSGGVQGRAFLGDPEGEAPNVGLVGTVDLHRMPWLDHARDSLAGALTGGTFGFELGGQWPAAQMIHFRGVESVGWPMELRIGETEQGGVRRTLGGGHTRAMRNCWPRGADGEQTCLSWLGGGGAEIHDGTYAYATVQQEYLPVEAVRVGPLRVDAALGMSSVSRSLLAPPEDVGFFVTAFTWDVKVRAHLGDVTVQAGTDREPYAAADSTLAFDDRVELSVSAPALGATWTATAVAARTRWWTAPDPAGARSDSLGGEVEVVRRIAGVTLDARAAVGSEVGALFSVHLAKSLAYDSIARY